DFHVTGVQTCALPISRFRQRFRQRPRERSLTELDRKRTVRIRLRNAQPVRPLQSIEIERFYPEAGAPPTTRALTHSPAGDIRLAFTHHPTPPGGSRTTLTAWPLLPRLRGTVHRMPNLIRCNLLKCSGDGDGALSLSPRDHPSESEDAGQG